MSEKKTITVTSGRYEVKGIPTGMLERHQASGRIVALNVKSGAPTKQAASKVMASTKSR